MQQNSSPHLREDTPGHQRWWQNDLLLKTGFVTAPETATGVSGGVKGGNKRKEFSLFFFLPLPTTPNPSLFFSHEKRTAL